MYIFKKFVSRYYALFSKYGVSVRTHVHEGICIPLVVKHELSRHITTSRGQYIIAFYMTIVCLLLHCCYTTECCHFSVEECEQGLLLCFCLCCVNSRWSTWVVRVDAPRKIFKPHSQISRLGMWTICFPIYTKGLFIGLFF